MKKVFLTAMIFSLIFSFGSVFAEGDRPEPGMSAVLERGGYYGIGADIPEGSYILTCRDNEETEWTEACDILLSTYDLLQYTEDTGLLLELPEGDEGYEPLRVFLQNGMILRIRYSDLTITAAEPITDGILESHGYYGIGYDIPEGSYYFSCIADEEEEWYDTCRVSILTYDSFLGRDFSLDMYVDSWEEDGSVHPAHMFLKAGTILHVMGNPVKIAEADPIVFK